MLFSTHERFNRQSMDALYHRLNRRKYVHPDPLEFLYGYGDIRDREIVGLIASSLAYGRVAMILQTVDAVLKKMGNSPYGYLMHAGPTSLRDDFSGFFYRFARRDHLVDLMLGAKRVIGCFGSLQSCLLGGISNSDENVLNGLIYLAEQLTLENKMMGHLVPLARRGSASKRLNLFLRWMVRSDSVDIGGWEDVRPSQLIVPLDTHMHRFALALGCTTRKQADMKTALEITACFKSINAEDPVRYDFSLTRLGIRGDLDFSAFYQRHQE